MSDHKRPAAKVIRADQAKVTEWLPPHVHRKGETALDEAHGLLTASQLDEIRKAAQQEGFEQGRKEGQAYGHREGLEQGRTEIQDRVSRLEQLLMALDRPFEQLDQQVENEIVTLVISMVRQLIRPALEAGKVVICDRFADSTRMYQGLSRGDLDVRVVDDALDVGLDEVDGRLEALGDEQVGPVTPARLARPVQLQPVQPRGRQHDRVVAPLAQAVHARRHVAAQVEHDALEPDAVIVALSLDRPPRSAIDVLVVDGAE